ncbi:MAG TPA: hypothetical protein PKC21_07200 [Oligoflexia bacterium]|nr:hypothetical protein [Oligoflexia bacterium]HMR25124.1 hypothetical protein [Oligoflexia bacterium]
MLKKSIVLGIILSNSVLFAQGNRPQISIPVVHLVSDYHTYEACKEKRKEILLQANEGEVFAGFEGLYDKQHIQYLVEGIGGFQFNLSSGNQIYPIENIDVYKAGRVLSLLQALDRTIHVRMAELQKKSNGQPYDQQKINFFGERLGVKFSELNNIYAGDERLRKKFEEFLGISLIMYVQNGQQISKAVQSRYPNILNFINTINKDFFWDEIRPKSNNNFFSSYINEVFETLSGDLKNKSVILDSVMIAKAKAKALELAGLKESRDNYARSQPEYWLYTIYWRNQMFIEAFDRMYTQWRNSADNKDKDIYLIVGADHIQDLHDKIKFRYAINAKIDTSCHD